MVDVVSQTQLENAAADCDTISLFANGDVAAAFTSRLGASLHSLAYLQSIATSSPGTSTYGTTASPTLGAAIPLSNGYNGFSNLSSGVLPLTLPLTPTDGDTIEVKDEGGTAGDGTHQFHITDPRSGGTQIEGQDYIEVAVNYGGAKLRFNSIKSKWFVKA